MVNVTPGKLIYATAHLYWDCIKKASHAFVRNWLILVGAVIAYFVFLFASSAFGWMGIGGAFLVGFIKIALVAFYLGWIADAVREEKVDPRSMIQFDIQLFFDVISVAFILFIATYVVNSLIQGMGVAWIALLMQLGIVIIFNAVPETIYIHRYQSVHALSHAAVFTRDNWIEWFFPLVVVLLPLLLLSGELTLVFLAQSDVILPIDTIITAWSLGASSYIVLFSVIGVLLAHWFMLFRGYLYRELESGTRRQRIFRSGM